MTDPQPKFEDIAVALSCAASMLRLDLEQVEMMAARIDLSQMGTALATVELKKNLALIAHAHEFFRENAHAESAIRDLAAGKRRGWRQIIAKVAAL